MLTHAFPTNRRQSCWRFVTITTILGVGTWLLIGCGSSSSGGDTGGNSRSGGATGSGGAAPSGGPTGSGGTTSSGGATATGGIAGPGSGGSNGTGGGIFGSGGSIGNGGQPGSGGAGSGGTAGTSIATGGATAGRNGTAAGGRGGATTGGAGAVAGNAGFSGGIAGAGGTGGPACDASPGMALQFAQTTVDLMTGDLGADMPPGDVPRTIEAWVKYTGANSWRAEGSIMETGRATGGQNRVMGLDNSGYTAGTMTAQFGPYTNGYSDNNNPNGVFVPGIAQVGWIHLSWAYTGNRGTFSFTVNGTPYPVTTQAGAPTMAFTTGVVTLGASQNFGFGGFDGLIDEVRIWSVARTPAEIARDMKVVLKGTEPGLVAYYRFREGSGTFTDDVSMKASHRLSVCSAVSGQRCAAMNMADPRWVPSDIPGSFSCAP